MAVRAGRLIAAVAGFLFIGIGMWFPRLFRPGAGLRLAPLEIFAKRRGHSGLFSGVRRVLLLGHRSPVSRLSHAFKALLAGAGPLWQTLPAQRFASAI